MLLIIRCCCGTRDLQMLRGCREILLAAHGRIDHRHISRKCSEIMRIAGHWMPSHAVTASEELIWTLRPLLDVECYCTETDRVVDDSALPPKREREEAEVHTVIRVVPHCGTVPADETVDADRNRVEQPHVAHRLVRRCL